MQTKAEEGMNGMNGMKKRLGLLIATSAVALLGVVPAANAAVGFTVNPNFPSSVNAGQTDQPGSLSFTNDSSAPHDAAPVNITSITMTPSCGDFGDPCATPDPDVVSIDTPATGAGGSGCAGISFTAAITHVPTGRYTFTPNAMFTLDLNETCTIPFTFDVLKVPTVDAAPISPGIQTNANATVSGQGAVPFPDTGQGQGSDTYTVGQAGPGLVLTAAASGFTGSPISATAAIEDASFEPTGNVTFDVWGPDNATCTGPSASTVVVPVTSTGFGGVATAQFTPTAPGVYRWIANYPGDINNADPVTACNDPDSTTMVTDAPPPTPPTQTQTPSTTAPAPTSTVVTTTTKKCKKGRKLKKGKCVKKKKK